MAWCCFGCLRGRYPTDAVWHRITSQDGINDEMGPYLKMTMPHSFCGRSIGDVTPRTRIGRSYLLLFGVIPFGFDDCQWTTETARGRT